MTISIRKKLSSIALALLFAVTCFFAVVGASSKPAKAISPYLPPDVYGNVYYFCDSTPSFDVVAGNEVIYDAPGIVTSKELEFLLYTGYFWGLEELGVDIALIEINTFEPERNVLESLFECLKAQNCKTMFISPYVNSYGELYCVDVSMQCNSDEYVGFIYNNMVQMSYTGAFSGGNTTILLDRRFVTWHDIYDADDLAELFLTSPTMRRILYYAIGFVGGNISTFESNLYGRLWEIYQNSFLHDYGYDNLNYFNGYNDIGSYIDAWQDIEEQDPGAVIRFWRDIGLHFNGEESEIFDNAIDAVNERYMDLVAPLKNKNIRILSHIYENTYLDIVNCQVDVLYNYLDVVGEPEYGVRAYAMGICPMDGYYDHLLDNTQKRIEHVFDNPKKVQVKIDGEIKEVDCRYPLPTLPVYLWGISSWELSNYGNGLKVITADMLYDYFSSEEKIDQEVLYATFEERFGELITMP